jgi:glycine/D-amino acid oxidase-like deaminating enzyme
MAAELTEFETRQVFDIKKFVEQERIECDFELTRTIDVYTDERVAGPVVEAYKRMKESEGYEFAEDLHYIPGERGRAEQVSGVKGALCAFSYTAASLWPWKLVMGILCRVVGMGGNLQTNTVVWGVEREEMQKEKQKQEGEGDDDGDGDGGGRWVLRTERGSVRAKNVVVTTNAYTGQLLNKFEGKITPARGVACRIATSTSSKHDGEGEGEREGVRARPPPHLNNTYSIRFGPQEYDYLISRTDGSIVVGGAKQAVLLDDSYWRDNSDDSQLIPGAREYFTGYMQRHFHGWEGTDAQITDIWTGVMGYSADLMPWVGEVPGREGVFVSAGFTGHGMPRILGCAEAVAGLVRDRVRGQAKNGMQGMQGTKVPRPYWVTKERLEEKRDISREYMAGARAKEGTTSSAKL